eukprot:scaffold846_cov252-Pinguiococcus_pyrenoidosus.AAC.2
MICERRGRRRFFNEKSTRQHAHTHLRAPWGLGGWEACSMQLRRGKAANVLRLTVLSTASV